MLDAYEKAFAERPDAKHPRFRIEHAQILDAADIPRFGRLGVLASMQGIHCPSDRPWAPKRLGDARVAEGGYVWRKLLASGARILNGTDAPVEDVSAIQNFHASVTRAGADGQPPGGFDPDQKLSRAEALRTMTLDAAYGSFAERERGSIEVGKVADLVVFVRGHPLRAGGSPHEDGRARHDRGRPGALRKEVNGPTSASPRCTSRRGKTWLVVTPACG